MDTKLTEQQISCYFSYLIKLVRYGRTTEIDAFIHKNPDACQMFMTPVRQGEHCLSLLMLAASNGHDSIVRMMLKHTLVDKNQIEQEGSLSISNNRLMEHITPLWLALVRQHYHVAHTLIYLGNARVDHGPNGHLLFEAIRHGRLQTMKFLIENGYADANETILIKEQKFHTLYVAVSQGHTPIVEYLLSRNVNLNQQSASTADTPLHAAVLEGNLDVARLLCAAGALITIRNARGATPLMIAAEKNNQPMLHLFLDYNHDKEMFDGLELVASSIFVSPNRPPRSQIDQMVTLLRLSLSKRILFGQPKKNILPPILAFDHHQECQSIEELEQIQNDVDRLIIEALLIQERIFLLGNLKNLLKPLLNHFFQSMGRADFTHSLNLLFHLLDLQKKMRIRVGLTLFVWVFCKMITAKVLISVKQFLDICHLSLESLSSTVGMDDHIMDTLYFTGLASTILKQTTTTDQERHSIIQWIKALCRKQPRTTTGRTLLHLSVVDASYKCHRSHLTDIQNVIEFPNLNVTRLLLSYGNRSINIDAIDKIDGDTPLHSIAKCASMFANDENIRIAELLINAGAHTDCANDYGLTPSDFTGNETIRTLIRSKEGCPRLKCLCANMIGDRKIEYEQIWPESTEMNKFLHLHRGAKRKRSMSDDDDGLWLANDSDIEDL